MCRVACSANRLMASSGASAVSEAIMTDENGRLLGKYRTMTDKHDHLVRMYRTVWWPKTRRMITHRVVHRSNRLLGLIDGVNECDEKLRGDIEAEIERLRNDAMTPPSGRMPPRQHAIWDAAMDSFLDPVKLADNIINDEAVRGLKRGVTQEQGLRVILRSYLNARYREIEGQTEYEHRVWAKLHPISNDLMLEYPRRHGHLPPPRYRCSWEHAEEIRASILRYIPKDGLVGKGAEYRRQEGMENGEFERLLRLAKRELRRRLDPEK
jgi:hypothetical protein